MSRPFVNSLWVVTVVAAFAAGYLWAGASRTAPPAVSTALLPADRDGEVVEASAPRVASISREAAGTSMRERTFGALGEANQVERLRGFSRLLSEITRENWREVRDAFIQQAATSGKSTAEWKLLLERVGQVAGAMAVTEAMTLRETDREERLPALLTGWGSADADAAVAWVREHRWQSRELAEAVYNGVARADPQKAVELALTNFVGCDKSFGFLLDGLAQRGEFERADALLSAVGSRTDVETRYKDFFMQALVKRKVEAVSASDPLKTLAWLEPYVGQDWVRSEPIYYAVSFAAEVDPAATMLWVDTHVTALGEGFDHRSKAGDSIGAAASAWYKKEPVQFAAWLDGHADHPYLNSALNAAVGFYLAHGQVGRVREFIDTLGNVDVRAVAENMVKQAEARNAQ